MSHLVGPKLDPGDEAQVRARAAVALGEASGALSDGRGRPGDRRARTRCPTGCRRRTSAAPPSRVAAVTAAAGRCRLPLRRRRRRCRWVSPPEQLVAEALDATRGPWPRPPAAAAVRSDPGRCGSSRQASADLAVPTLSRLLTGLVPVALPAGPSCRRCRRRRVRSPGPVARRAADGAGVLGRSEVSGRSHRCPAGGRVASAAARASRPPRRRSAGRGSPPKGLGSRPVAGGDGGAAERAAGDSGGQSEAHADGRSASGAQGADATRRQPCDPSAATAFRPPRAPRRRPPWPCGRRPRRRPHRAFRRHRRSRRDSVQARRVQRAARVARPGCGRARPQALDRLAAQHPLRRGPVQPLVLLVGHHMSFCVRQA